MRCCSPLAGFNWLLVTIILLLGVIKLIQSRVTFLQYTHGNTICRLTILALYSSSSSRCSSGIMASSVSRENKAKVEKCSVDIALTVTIPRHKKVFSNL